MYKEWILNTLTHKGLRQYIVSSARKLKEAELRDNGEYYLPKAMKALTEDEIEELEMKSDDFLQKEASVREVFYEMVG
jgi:hypothetical protein